MEATPLHPRLSIRLFRTEKCFGPGIAQLLELVEEHRSLRGAAKAMDMAYSKAWTMVRRCEESSGRQLLIYATGGRNGGGATLTEDARRLLASYRAYCRAVEAAADELFAEAFAWFDEPGGGAPTAAWQPHPTSPEEASP